MLRQHMIYGDAQSSFDLRFRLLGFPVRVSPYFFLIAALFGYSFTMQIGKPVVHLVVWIVLMFLSILLHEMGHALAYRLFGSPSEISLHGFGGYAIGYPPRQPWKRIIISFAGPLAQLLLAGVVWLSAFLTGWPLKSDLLTDTFFFLLLMNIFWPIFNLLPMLPLDGGNIMREVFAILRFRNADAAAHAVSVFVAGILVIRGVAAITRFKIPILDDILPIWLTPGPFMTFYFVMFAIDNAQMYQRFRQRGPVDYDDGGYNDDTPPWRRR